MLYQNRDIASLFFGFTLLAACQAGQKPQDETVSSPQSAVAGADTAVAESSEGIVGPDEAFFAERYLDQVFRYSTENNSPSLEPSVALTRSAPAGSAFDFAANFSDKRLGLMVKALYLQGDADKDGALTEAEFSSLKLDPSVLGVSGEALTHSYSETLFARLSGDDALLQADECATFLRDIGSSVKAVLDRQSAQDQRLAVIRAWEKILGRYDADQNGSLSLQEQRDLRKDRTQILGRLLGE